MLNKTTVSKERINISKEIHKYVHERAPYIWLYRLEKIMAYRKELVIDVQEDIVPKLIFTHISFKVLTMQEIEQL